MRVVRSAEAVQRYIAEFEMADFLNDNLLASLELFHFPAFTNIFTEQDEQHYLYFLVRGQVQCSHYHLNGKLAVFAVSTPFAAIGDLEILTEERVHSNVIATQETTMLGIASRVVDHYGADDPRFLCFLIDQIREKLYRTSLLQVNQVLPVINRLAVYMLSQPANEEGAIVLPGKEELASLLSTTPRHLNRVLNALVASGSINSGYPLVRIRNRPALQAVTR